MSWCPVGKLFTNVCGIEIAGIPAGIPAISIPQTFVNNLPTGHQLIAPHLNEELILQTAHHFQQDTDWHLKSPSMEDFT